MDTPENPTPQASKPVRFVWLRLGIRLLWYLLLLVLIVVLFQGPEKGFRYLGL